MNKGGRICAALAFMAGVGAVWLSGAQAAHADYRFCNATSYVLEGAIGVALKGVTPTDEKRDGDKLVTADALAGGDIQGAGQWQSQGWTQILPGECASVLVAPLVKDNYYVFARSSDAHKGPTKYFSGSARFCTLTDAFTITGRENCAMRGYVSHDFIRVAVKDTGEWTTTFGEPHDYLLAQARIAGAQRLLRDNGLHLPKIDGYAAKNTQRAVLAFQRTSGRQPTGVIDHDLVAALIVGAKAEQAKFGLNICNKTRYLVWAAVAVSTDDNDTSNGWIRIAPGACAKAIKDKLDGKPYYIYAEAIDKDGTVAMRDGRRLVWSGRQVFCVKTTRFEIEGREACATRGYDERAFMRVKTGGKALFNVPLE